MSTCNGEWGNGNKIASEECDDANIYNGDGCSENWTIEVGYAWTTIVHSVCHTVWGDGK